MGDVDDVHLSPERIRERARELVRDAERFTELIEGAKQGLRTAATDAAPWYSAGGWGMFKQPAAAADDADRFVSEVDRDIREMGRELEDAIRNLANVDENSSAALDKVGKVIYRDE